MMCFFAVAFTKHIYNGKRKNNCDLGAMRYIYIYVYNGRIDFTSGREKHLKKKIRIRAKPDFIAWMRSRSSSKRHIQTTQWNKTKNDSTRTLFFYFARLRAKVVCGNLIYSLFLPIILSNFSHRRSLLPLTRERPAKSKASGKKVHAVIVYRAER